MKTAHTVCVALATFQLFSFLEWRKTQM